MNIHKNSELYIYFSIFYYSIESKRSYFIKFNRNDLVNQKKLLSISAAFLTFIIVGILAVQSMYYIKGYHPSTNMLEHQFLVSIGFLIGIIAASFIYTNLQENDGS